MMYFISGICNIYIYLVTVCYTNGGYKLYSPFAKHDDILAQEMRGSGDGVMEAGGVVVKAPNAVVFRRGNAVVLPKWRCDVFTLW